MAANGKVQGHAESTPYQGWSVPRFLGDRLNIERPGSQQKGRVLDELTQLAWEQQGKRFERRSSAISQSGSENLQCPNCGRFVPFTDRTGFISHLRTH